ncbi:zinc finger and BTB domain-containing protein 34 [Brienomyrus brachyistius]|uniref:zinc finger and BTB domain-containing protein 34 n=1 Tax=Brienomyrus brachyistius TaxID=42636 RepID=UPI0020B2D35E|nr:zinc finger and BTB domain-containing protein 34 [Brienomyrus brachyistius]
MEDGSGLIEFDVPEFSSTVLSQLNELRLQGKLCDIVVHIQGRPFRAHKAVLAASSPYFRDHSALGTMSGLSLSVIKSPEVFERLLAFCYTGRMALPLKDVVSFLTAASFLQMQAIIDKCTQILEGIHSKISLPPGGSPGGDSPQGNRDGFKDGGAFLNPVQVSPPYFPLQPTALPGAAEARPDAGGKGPPRPRAPEEGQSDRGSSSDGAPEQEAELEQVELIGRDGQVTDVRVKMEKAERPSCSDSSSAGDDGYHTELVDGEQVLAVSVGSYGPMLQPAGYTYPPLSASAFVSLSSASPSRSILSGFRGGRARPKRPAATSPEAPGRPKPFREDGDAVSAAAAVVAAAASPAASFESDVRERSLRGQWYPYSERLVCIYCGKSFNQKGSLDRHMRLHMGITPFVCKFCGKKYTRKDQLEYHIRGHTDNKPFHCQICGKCFPFQGTLNQHLRKKHMGAVDGGNHADSPERTEAPATGDAPPPAEEPSGNGEESTRGSPEESPHGSRCDF